MRTDKQVESKKISAAAPLISVIVPIYNVERYVRKCLNSLVAQTLREIEVICIDDGSTDGSGKIADEYESNEFPIFRVTHTENRGLSAARNRGIDEATAEWIMFVDSDDWVEPDFCRVPYEAAIENQADLVIFGGYRVSEYGRIIKPKKTTNPTGIVDEMTAHEYGSVTAWNKIYHKKLFDGIQYPVGQVFEDYAVTHRVVHSANRIILLKNRVYFHVNRKNSISHTHTLSNQRDRLLSTINRYNELISYGYPENKMKTSMLSAAIGFLLIMNDENEELSLRAIEIIDSYSDYSAMLNVKKDSLLQLGKITKAYFV